MPEISGDILGPGILFGLGALILSSLLVFVLPQTFDGPGNTSAATILFLTYTFSSVLGVSTHTIDQANLLFSTALANLVLALLAIFALSRVGLAKSGRGVAGGSKPRNVVILEAVLIGLGVIGSVYSQIYEGIRSGRSAECTLNTILVGLQALLGGCITSPYMLGVRCITPNESIDHIVHPHRPTPTTDTTANEMELVLSSRFSHHTRSHNASNASTITATTPESPTAPTFSLAKKHKHAQLRRRLITVPLAAATALASVGFMLYAKIGLDHDVQGDREGWSVRQMFAAAPGFVGLYSTILQGMYTLAAEQELDALLEEKSDDGQNRDEDNGHDATHEVDDGQNELIA